MGLTMGNATAVQTPVTRLIDEHAKCVARIAELEAALMPLAAWARFLKSDTPNEFALPADVPHLTLTMAHSRAALAALTQPQEKK